MEVKLFGIAKDIVGASSLHLGDEIPEGSFATVGQLKQWLAAQYPGLGHLRSLAVAVDSEYAQDDEQLHHASEIALIPPVSGG